MLNADYKNAQKRFYKKIKNMRNTDDIYEPTEIINDEKGNALKEPKQIIERWQQYFKELLNLKEKTQQ